MVQTAQPDPGKEAKSFAVEIRNEMSRIRLNLHPVSRVLSAVDAVNSLSTSNWISHLQTVWIFWLEIHPHLMLVCGSEVIGVSIINESTPRFVTEVPSSGVGLGSTMVAVWVEVTATFFTSSMGYLQIVNIFLTKFIK